MEIIALKEYTDKYVSLYEGQIRNITDAMAERLIEEGVVAEHGETSPSGGSSEDNNNRWIKIDLTSPPDFFISPMNNEVKTFQQLITYDISNSLPLNTYYGVRKIKQSEYFKQGCDFLIYQTSLTNDNNFIYYSSIKRIENKSSSVLWMSSNLLVMELNNNISGTSQTLIQGKDLQLPNKEKYTNISSFIDNDEWVVVEGASFSDHATNTTMFLTLKPKTI